MDTVTHIVLGACIGELVAGKQLGKKALAIGAFAQSIPDFDFVASFWLPTSADLLAHRGFTHSFAFIILLTPLLGFLSASISRRDIMPRRRWMMLWGMELFVHIFIDAFNAYGTGWFEPFSHYRVSFNTLFVADPLFSLWPAIACVILLIFRRSNPRRKWWALAAITLSSVYLVTSIAFKLYADVVAEKSFSDKNISYRRYFATPTPLNDILWYVVAENDSGYYIGYTSVLDRRKDIDFHFASRNDSLLTPYKGSQDLNNLERFAQGYYVVNKENDTLVFNDLRFGEILGWNMEHPRFVFHYYLNYTSNNKMVVQRGRFAGWDKETFQLFLKRIGGI